MNRNTAILFFSSSASLQQKSLSSISEKADAKVKKLLYRSTLDKIKASGLPIIFSQDCNQLGNTLGEKLAHAFQLAYESGFENVIAVGDDTPGLQTSHLLQASEILRSGQMVLGPSRDGGLYLLALSKSEFDGVALASIIDCKEAQAARFTTFALEHGNGEPAILSVQCDLDDSHSVSVWKSLARSVSAADKLLINTLINLLLRHMLLPKAQHLQVEGVPSRTIVGRGPP